MNWLCSRLELGEASAIYARRTGESRLYRILSEPVIPEATYIHYWNMLVTRHLQCTDIMQVIQRAAY